MNKIVAGFCVCHYLLSLLSGMMDGNAGAAVSTKLTIAADEDDVTFDVVDTTGFQAGGGVIIVRGEKVEYTATAGGNQFIGLDRGIEGTTAGAHPIGAAVYNEDRGILNYIFGFNVVSTQIPGGTASVMSSPWEFMAESLPRIVSWNYSFLQGDMVILRDIMMSLSLGFIIYLAFMAINTVVGVLSKVI